MNEIKKDFRLKPFTLSESGLLISSEVSVQDNHIMVLFNVRGNLSKLHIPSKKNKSSRVIGLWNTTCFEIFLRSESKQEYIEFNFSPSHDWNCFRFLTISDDLKEWGQIKEASIDSKLDKDEYVLYVKINKANLPQTFEDIANIYISTTAVINYDGINEYWAIKHTDNRPNFHHPESYVKLINTTEA